MTMKEIELLQAYLYNRSVYLENELAEMRNRFRFRPVDASDCLELSLMIQRVQDFREFSQDIRYLLHISNGRVG